MRLLLILSVFLSFSLSAQEQAGEIRETNTGYDVYDQNSSYPRLEIRKHENGDMEIYDRVEGRVLMFYKKRGDTYDVYDNREETTRRRTETREEESPPQQRSTYNSQYNSPIKYRSPQTNSRRKARLPRSNSQY